MPVSTREQLIKRLQEKDPKEKVFYFLLQKEYIAEDFNAYELTDENDEWLEIKTEQVTEEMSAQIFNAIDNSENIFNEFSEAYDELVKEVIVENLFAKPTEDKEEMELWEQ